MFDAALAAATDYAFTQAPAAMIQPAILPLDIAAFERSVEERIGTARAAFEEWQSMGRIARTAVLRAVEYEARPSPALAARLMDLVTQIEIDLDDLSQEILERAKLAERRWDRVAKLYPQLARSLSIAQTFGFDLARQEIEDRSEYILFLRSVCAEFDPNARDGREFASSAELSRYLDSLLN